MRVSAAAIAALVALAACVAGPVDERQPGAAPARAPTSPPVDSSSMPRREPAPAPAAAPAAGAPAQDAAAPPGSDANVARLQGMNPDDVRTLLGPAEFVRRDGPAEIWRYAADDCFLDVFLFRGRESAMTVQHVEARARTRAAQQWVTLRHCYARVIDLRKTAPAG
jgi:hypothetical protein